MRVRLLVNPKASSMTPARWAHLEAGLAASHRVDTVATKARGHATALAAAAAADGIEVVVVAAGDGTLNEAAAGLLGTATALAALPGGSTNVFARAVGFPNRLRPALAALLVALGTDPVRPLGIGLAGDRPFLCHLGAGFDAAVVARMERLDPRVKRIAAHPAFAWQTLRTLAHGVARATPVVHVTTPDGQHHAARFTVVSNLAPYSYVGPRRMLLTPDAGPDRPLAVTSMTRLRLRDAVGAFGSSVGRARHLQHTREVVQLRDVHALRLEAPDGAFPWQVDGDHLGTTATLDVRYAPDALRVVLPVRPGAGTRS